MQTTTVETTKAFKSNRELHSASIRKDLQKTKELLKSGTDPSEPDALGWTPLHEACGAGCPDIVETLLKAGSNPNARSHTMETPAMIAAAHGHHKALEKLKLFGADFSLRDRAGDTLQEIAAKAGHFQTSRWLSGETVLTAPAKPKTNSSWLLKPKKVNGPEMEV